MIFRISATLVKKQKITIKNITTIVISDSLYTGAEITDMQHLKEIVYGEQASGNIFRKNNGKID
jgi:hypothetical protein